MTHTDELDVAEYEHLMAVAERDGLCCNCFHTYECCGGTCWAMSSNVDENTHECAGTPEPRPFGWGWA